MCHLALPACHCNSVRVLQNDVWLRKEDESVNGFLRRPQNTAVDARHLGESQSPVQLHPRLRPLCDNEYKVRRLALNGGRCLGALETADGDANQPGIPMFRPNDQTR